MLFTVDLARNVISYITEYLMHAHVEQFQHIVIDVILSLIFFNRSVIYTTIKNHSKVFPTPMNTPLTHKHFYIFRCFVVVLFVCLFLNDNYGVVRNLLATST